MLAIYMVKPNKRAFSTQFKIENRQTKKYAILSLNGLFLFCWLNWSILFMKRKMMLLYELLMLPLVVVVILFWHVYSNVQSNLVIDAEITMVDGCCTQAVRYLLLARYCYKLYIFIFKWIPYEMRERDCMKFSRLLSIGNLSSMENSKFLSKCQQRKRYWVHPLVVPPPHTSIGQTAKCCAFIVGYIGSLMFESQFYGFISAQWVRGFAHGRCYLDA